MTVDPEKLMSTLDSRSSFSYAVSNAFPSPSLGYFYRFFILARQLGSEFLMNAETW